MKLIYLLVFCVIQFLFFTSLTAQIGDPAPDFTITDIHGQKHHLYEYLNQNKKVLLDFFFTTCIPCQYYSPQVNKAYEKYGCNTQDVIFLSIDYDDTDAEVSQYEETYKTDYPTASGLEGGGNAVINQYGIQAFPTLLLIDSTKKIIDEISPPTLIVFDFIFTQYGITPKTCLTATNNQIKEQSMFIYPNPIRYGKIQVYTSHVIGSDAQFEIMDFSGKVMKQYPIKKLGENNCSLEVSEITAGSYLLKFSTRNYKPQYSKILILK